MTDDANATGRRPIAMIFRKTAHRAVRCCRRHGVSANAVSAASLVAGIGSGLALVAVRWLDSHAVFLAIGLGIALSILRLWLNMLDGMVAMAGRAEGDRDDALGALFNEAPDRLSDLALLIGVAHSGLCHPLTGYGAAIAALAVAYVGTLGQALGAGRRFEGWMSKPWRVVAVLLGATVTVLSADRSVPLAGLPFTLTSLDVALLVLVVGAIETISRRLVSIAHRLITVDSSSLS